VKRVASLLAVVALVGCGGGDVEGDLVVTADRVFDGRELIERGVVVVRGDEIVAVGEQDELDASAPKRLDLGDATVLPGLVDLHVHALGEGQRWSAVTSVRDVGASEAAVAAFRQERGAPRVVFAGPLLTVPGGYPIPVHGRELAGVVRDVAGARTAVRRLAREGAGVVKVSLEWGRDGRWPVLSLAQLEAIADEAHDLGLPVTAHVSSTRGARMALAAGVDDLAHMPCVGTDETLMRDLVAAGVEIVGTLHVIDEFDFCPVVDYARAFVRAGGTLLYGTDYGNSGVPPGVDVDELRLMVRAGLSRREALRNATSRAGEQLGVEKVGTLQEGAPADLVAVDGDPFSDLERLEVPRLVVVRGDIVVDNGRQISPGG
jgi:imidazolonepropionase-like amidohydrolase